MTEITEISCLSEGISDTVRSLATFGSSSLCIGSAEILVHDVVQNSSIRILREHSRSIYSLTSSSNKETENLLFSGSADRTLKAWDLSVNSGSVKTLSGLHTNTIRSLHLSEGLLYSGGYDHLVQVVDLRNWKVLATWNYFKSNVNFIVALPKEKQVLVGSGHTVYVLDEKATGKGKRERKEIACNGMFATVDFASDSDTEENEKQKEEEEVKEEEIEKLVANLSLNKEKGKEKEKAKAKEKMFEVDLDWVPPIRVDPRFLGKNCYECFELYLLEEPSASVLLSEKEKKLYQSALQHSTNNHNNHNNKNDEEEGEVFDPSRTHFIAHSSSSSGFSNSLFRGNEPATSNLSFAYSSLVSTMRSTALSEGNFTLPSEFYIIDINLLNELKESDREDIALEKAFFSSHPHLGEFVNWVIAGDLTSPLDYPKFVRKEMAKEIEFWQFDKLHSRIPWLQKTLNEKPKNSYNLPYGY